MALREKVKRARGQARRADPVRRGERRDQREGAPPVGGARRRARLPGAGARRSTSTCARTSPCRTSRCASGARACRPTSTRPGRWTRRSASTPRTMGAPQCGPAAGNPFVPWFGEAGEHVRSMALVPLGQTAVFGLLALGSEDAKRFFPGDGHALPSPDRRAMRSRSHGATLAARIPRCAEAPARGCRRATLRNYAHAHRRCCSSLHGRARPESAGAGARAPLRRHAARQGPRAALARAHPVGVARLVPLARAPPGLAANPVLGIRAPKAARPLPKALSVEAAQQLLDGESETSPR